MEKGKSVKNNNEVQTASAWWIVLGFFVPLAGIILFIVWNKTDPEKGNKAGLGALLGFVTSMFMPVILFSLLIIGVNNGKIEKFINKMNCYDYGTNYDPYQIDGEWYCKNRVNGKIVDPYEDTRDCKNGDCYIEDDEIEGEFGFSDFYDDDLDEDEELEDVEELEEYDKELNLLR